MLTFNANQLSILNSPGKRIIWLFIITDINSNVYFWSTKNGALPGIVFTHKIADFESVEMSSPMSEAGLQVPTTTGFSILNADAALTDSDFKGGSVIVRLYVGDKAGYELMRGWKFTIKTAKSVRRRIVCKCEDYIQKYIKNSYPATPLVSDLVFTQDLYVKKQGVEDNVCPPVPFGLAYVPVRSIYIDGDDRYFVLGPTDKTYAITKVRSPRALGAKSEWNSIECGGSLVSPSGVLYSAGGYAFTQSTITDRWGTNWQVFQPIISDKDNDGVAESCGVWQNGQFLRDLPTQLNCSDTKDMTNPSDVISFVMQDMGMSTIDLDAVLFATAKAVYTGWALEWNGAFWYKEYGDKILAKLLNMCHSTFRIGETIGLRTLSKVSQATITKADVVKGTFQRNEIDPSEYDSGYVSWQPSGEAQDTFIELLVSVDGMTANNPQSSVMECPFVQDSVAVQKLKQLRLERELLIDGDVTFTSKGTLLALECDDLLNVNHADYGGTYGAIIDKMKINKGLTIEFQCSSLSAALDDWGDISPAAITVAADTTVNNFEPAISGPLSDQPAGKFYNVFGMAMDTPWITVSPNTRDGMFTSLEAAVAFFTASPPESGKIYIRNGMYDPPSDVITMPNKNLEIEGQTRDGVILRNKLDKDLFYFHNLIKEYRLSNFTTNAQAGTVQKYMFYILGDTAAQNSSNIELDRIRVILPSRYESMINADKGIGSIKLTGSITTGGRRLIRMTAYRDIHVQNNQFNNQIKASTGFFYFFSIFDTDGVVNIIDNTFKDMRHNALYLYSTISAHTQVSGNKAYAASDASIEEIYMMYIHRDDAQIFSNIVEIKPSVDISSMIHGMSIGGNRVQCFNNNIVIVVDASGGIAGIYMIGDDGGVKGNIIKIDNSDNTTDRRGLHVYGGNSHGYRNVISGNNIDMVNSDAKDIGIHLDEGIIAWTGDNQGGDNIVNNAGTALSDGGSNNFVSGLDDGVPFP